MIVYSVRKWPGNQIEEVEVLKTTIEFVYLRTGKRETRVSPYGGYFNTEAEAIAFVKSVAREQLEQAERQLERRRAEWDAVADGSKIPVVRLKEG